MHPVRIVSRFRLSLLLPALPLLHAGPAIDLQRITPVAADQPIPIADFFRPPLLVSPVINRAGTDIAGIVYAAEDRASLMVYNIESKKTQFVHGWGDKDVYTVDWLDDSHVAYTLAAEKLFYLALLAADKRDLTASYPLLQDCGASILSVPDESPLQPLVWIRADLVTGRQGGAAIINAALNTGPLTNLHAAGANWSDFAGIRDRNQQHIVRDFPLPDGLAVRYLCDKDGALEFAITAHDGVETLQRLEGGRWLKCPVDLDWVEVITAGDKPGELVVCGPRESGVPMPLQFMEAATGRLGPVILHDKQYDFTGWLYRDPAAHVITGAAINRNGPRVVWFDDTDKAVQKLLDASFKGQVVQIVSRSHNGARVITRRFTDRQPPIYDWVDLEKHASGLIKNSAPWIDPARMRPTDIMRFKTFDGRELDAYLTLPAGASKQHPAPLVVLPHGGPYLRDNWGYSGEVQFLASRGYAVLQPNYRGSPGYDWQFPDSDRWDFVKMQRDVSAATKAALGSKLVDPARVAIVGGSFGGYLAVASVVAEPSLYRCAATIDGVFDWGDMMKQQKYWQFDTAEYGWLKRRLGDPRENAARFDAISPLRHIDQVHVPVFVAHGKEDQVVEVSQSRQLIDALRRNHVPCETLLVGGEGHGMGHLDNEVELYGRIEEFLAKNLAAPVEAPVAAK